MGVDILSQVVTSTGTAIGCWVLILMSISAGVGLVVELKLERRAE